MKGLSACCSLALESVLQARERVRLRRYSDTGHPKKRLIGLGLSQGSGALTLINLSSNQERPTNSPTWHPRIV